MTQNIERSPGHPIGVSGLRAGGGVKGLTADLDNLVTEAAEALSALYGGAPVTIRFNSDRMSGGVWLKTAEVDYIGGNAEVGINASLPVDDPSGQPSLGVSMRRVARAGDDWETDFAEREGAPAETVAQAIDILRERAVTDFDALLKRMDVLLERKRQAQAS